MKRSKEELELFYRLDEKKYLISENLELKNWLDKFECSYCNEDIQDFIDRLANWYFVKYPDKYFDAVIENHTKETCTSTGGMTINSLFKNFNTSDLNFVTFEGENKELKELFCQYLLQLVGYKMIYFKKSIPEYGLIRIKFMFWEFNHLFHWNLNTEIYDFIMERDYSMNNPDNLHLLETLREQQKKSKKRQKGKKKGLRRLLQR